MVEQKIELAVKTENGTPSLAINDLIKQAEKVLRTNRKVGKRMMGHLSHHKPYWQPVKGIIRWELRQHYYDSSGIRRTRVIKSQRHKPRGI